MHIVCHMAASVDGRLRPSRWSPFVEDCSVGGVYEEVANQYDYVGWMIGRVTMAEYSEAITESEPAKLRPAEAAPAQGIKVDPKGRKISVAFDFKGKLHYGQPVQETGEQIVTVVSDRVCDEYIEELRQSGVGVVAVPVNGNELVLAMEQLAKDYGDGVWMLEGGAIINAAFIQAGLVDEVSTVGLNYYFQQQLKTFIHHESDSLSLPNNYINHIVEDSLGTIWVATSKEMVLYNSDRSEEHTSELQSH